MDEIVEQRKQQAKDAGYTHPMCAACGNMSTPSSKECKRCMSATPMFSAAVKDFLTAVKGTRQ
jgi:uncharacterized OB-fold protein